MTKVKVILKLENRSDKVLIEPITKEIEGENLKQAVGTALHEANKTLNSQWDAPVVTINDVELSKTHSRQCKGAFHDFSLNFATIRETVMASLINYSDAASRLDYVKSTDRNGVYAKVKAVSVEQTAAQVSTQLRMTRDLVKWAKEDAKASVLTPEVEARRLFNQERAKAKRLEAQKVKAMLEKAEAEASTEDAK